MKTEHDSILDKWVDHFAFCVFSPISAAAIYAVYIILLILGICGVLK